MNFSEWIVKNGPSILIGLFSLVITFISTASLYGYRIQELERRQVEQTAKIESLTATNIQTLVSIARIETDIAYIKFQIDKIVR